MFPTDNSDATDEPADIPEEVGSTDKDIATVTTIAATMATETFPESTNSTFLEEDEHPLEFILMVLIPLILLATLLLSVVFIMIKYKRKKKKQGKYLACSNSRQLFHVPVNNR